MDDKEPFLSRWSRRKLETKEEAPAAAAAMAESRGVAAAPPPARASEAPAADAAQPGTPEYREFFDPQVDETLRRTALKKLFNEPQFNVMDGLDTYIDDYSLSDPIPDAMLRQLHQAKNLFLFDEETKPEAGAVDGAMAAGGPAQALPAAPADTGTPADPEPAGAGGADAATAAAPAPAPEGGEKD